MAANDVRKLRDEILDQNITMEEVKGLSLELGITPDVAAMAPWDAEYARLVLQEQVCATRPPPNPAQTPRADAPQNFGAGCPIVCSLILSPNTDY